jgi:hypothetical protein
MLCQLFNVNIYWSSRENWRLKPNYFRRLSFLFTKIFKLTGKLFCKHQKTSPEEILLWTIFNMFQNQIICSIRSINKSHISVNCSNEEKVFSLASFMVNGEEIFDKLLSGSNWFRSAFYWKLVFEMVGHNIDELMGCS